MKHQREDGIALTEIWYTALLDSTWAGGFEAGGGGEGLSVTCENILKIQFPFPA